MTKIIVMYAINKTVQFENYKQLLEYQNSLLLSHIWDHCIIKRITAIIYGYHNKLECLSLNARLGWRGLPGTNTLAYYRNRKLWP